MSVVYNTFNKNVKDWSSALDDAMQESINRSARKILMDLDRKVSELNETMDKKIEENE